MAESNLELGLRNVDCCVYAVVERSVARILTNHSIVHDGNLFISVDLLPWVLRSLLEALVPDAGDKIIASLVRQTGAKNKYMPFMYDDGLVHADFIGVSLLEQGVSYGSWEHICDMIGWRRYDVTRPCEPRGCDGCAVLRRESAGAKNAKSAALENARGLRKSVARLQDQLDNAKQEVQKLRNDALASCNRKGQGDAANKMTFVGGMTIALHSCVSNTSQGGLGLAMGQDMHRTTVGRW